MPVLRWRMTDAKPLKVGDRVIGAGDVTLRVDSIRKTGRSMMVVLVGVLSGASLPPMLLEKVEAMERAR